MEGIVLTADAIMNIASVVGAVCAILGTVFAIYRWYLRQNQQDEDILQLKKETALLTVGVLACLKGLKEQGCNGPVTDAIERIEEHLNERAHL